jgi:hypothetical protein
MTDHARYERGYLYHCRAICFQSIARVWFSFFLILSSLIALGQGLIRVVSIGVLFNLSFLYLTICEGYSKKLNHVISLTGLTCASYVLKGG